MRSKSSVEFDAEIPDWGIICPTTHTQDFGQACKASNYADILISSSATTTTTTTITTYVATVAVQ